MNKFAYLDPTGRRCGAVCCRSAFCHGDVLDGTAPRSAQLLVSGLEPVRQGCPTGSAGPNSVNYPNAEVEAFVPQSTQSTARSSVSSGGTAGMTVALRRWSPLVPRTVRAGRVTLRSSAHVLAVPQSTSALRIHG